MDLRVEMAVDEDTAGLAVLCSTNLRGPPIALGVFFAVNIDVKIVTLEIVTLPCLCSALCAL